MNLRSQQCETVSRLSCQGTMVQFCSELLADLTNCCSQKTPKLNKYVPQNKHHISCWVTHSHTNQCLILQHLDKYINFPSLKHSASHTFRNTVTVALTKTIPKRKLNKIDKFLRMRHSHK